MKATFFTNSYNRLRLMQNLLRSFETCVQSRDVEWVITDYGSTDGSREYLTEYAKQSSVPVRLILGDEQEFFRALPLEQIDRRARTETILRKYRNQARRAAGGDYLFDVGSDHQFIRAGDIVAEVEEVFRHCEHAVGRQDLSGVIAFGYFRWRLTKPNNAREAEASAGGVSYFVAKEKSYVDYSVMQRATAERVGPFLELGELGDNPARLTWWKNGNHLEMEYMERCEKLGLKRAFLKYPWLVTFTNAEAEQISELKRPANELIAPIWALSNMMARFGWLGRPVSSEELRGIMAPSMFERSWSILKQWRA